MSRWIDAEWIRNVYADFEHYENREDWTTPIANVLAVIDDAPRIDIVRCGECRFGQWHEQAEEYICIAHDQDIFDGDHFCSYGERRE